MAKKYEYKFVSVKLGGSVWEGRPNNDYRQEITANAQDGWRFVQAFAPAIGTLGSGFAGYTDLIFEREIEVK